MNIKKIVSVAIFGLLMVCIGKADFRFDKLKSDTCKLAFDGPYSYWYELCSGECVLKEIWSEECLKRLAKQVELDRRSRDMSNDDDQYEKMARKICNQTLARELETRLNDRDADLPARVRRNMETFVQINRQVDDDPAVRAEEYEQFLRKIYDPIPIAIPNRIDGHPVTTLEARKGENSIMDHKISSVYIPDSVRNIGRCTFNKQEFLTKIRIPSTVTNIGYSAFSGCSLKSITIPDGVINIGDYAFFGCPLENVEIPDSVISIGDHAFYGCPLKTVKIPDSVVSIGESAFDGTGIGRVELPLGVKLGARSFPYGCAIYFSTTALGVVWVGYEYGQGEFAIATGRWENDVSATVNGGLMTIPTLLKGRRVTAIGPKSTYGDCFLAHTNLTELVVPSSIKHIKSRAFENCDVLTSVTVRKGVQDIGEAAFRCCRRLQRITLPPSISHVGVAAFESCWQLKEISIPSCINSIGACAFANCSNLHTVRIVKARQMEECVQAIGEKAFEYCENMELIMPSQMPNMKIGRNAFNGCKSLEKSGFVIWHGMLLSITDPKGYGCEGQPSLPRITDDSENQCERSLSLSIEIPDGVTSISSCAFDNCNNIREVIIPSSVTNICHGAFDSCINLQRAYVSDDWEENPLYQFFEQCEVSTPSSRRRERNKIIGSTVGVCLCTAIVGIFFAKKCRNAACVA